MRASLEISLYPLQENYKNPILKFIEAVRSRPGLTVKTNVMSTQIFGTYDELMLVMAEDLKGAFLNGGSEKAGTQIAVCKLVNMDLDE